VKRRRLLRLSSGILAAIPLARFGIGGTTAQAMVPGEAYGGFLLLDWGDKLPEAVRIPARIPSLESLPGGGKATASYRFFGTTNEATAAGRPVLELSESGALRARPVEVLSHISGELFTTKLIYAAGGPEPVAPVVTIIRQAQFARPNPVWPGGNPDDGLLYPTKAVVRGKSALYWPLGTSSRVEWFEDGALYSLTVDGRDRSAVDLANALRAA